MGTLDSCFFMLGAFDTVSHSAPYPQHAKKKNTDMDYQLDRELKERSTTMTINGHHTAAFNVRTGIPQSSPILLILYLFNNADLPDICERPGTKANDLGFVDDVNILTYSIRNCETLKILHKKCEAWAARHAAFASAKYQLIHLS